MENKPNPELYEKLSQPFESQGEAQAAIESFLEEVGRLREQYKIPDVSLNMVAKVKMDGEVVEMTGGVVWGDSAKGLMIAKREFDRQFDAFRNVILSVANVAAG